jgi:hypothetical protein
MVMNELQYEHYIDSQPEEGDSSSFGWSLTANEKYLAVGDAGAGRVVIYHRSSQNKWVRFRTVSRIGYLRCKITESRYLHCCQSRYLSGELSLQ